jgi:tetratricopeptide (TPR) repeat protein
MVKDIEKKSLKAEKLYKAMQFKRAAKIFGSIGDSYLVLGNFELARENFISATECSINEEKYLIGIDFLRKAGSASLFRDEVLDANRFYREAMKYIPYLKSASERNRHNILFSCLTYLCHFVYGEPDEGLKVVKRAKTLVDDTFFKENELIHLVTNLTKVIQEKTEKYIERIKRDFNHFKFSQAEALLAKKALVIAKTCTSLKTKLSFDKDLYTTNEIINLRLEIDSIALLDVSEQDFYNYRIEDLTITKISKMVSDNLTSQRIPDLPIVIKVGEKKVINLLVKPHFQMENPFIGPVQLYLELNRELKFLYEISGKLIPNLISPSPTLNVSIKNLRPPLIDQTFPLEIFIENKSEGEAFNLNIDIEFPEQIKVMRGTLNKQIYSLRSNENIKWEINLKPLEAGNYTIKISSKFNDPDQNFIEDSIEFPLPIKL